MDKTGEGIDGSNAADVFLLIEYGLIQVRNAPAQRNVEIEKLGELRSSLGGVGVSPGPERHKQLIILVEGEVAVHHSAYAYGCKRLYLKSISGINIFSQTLVAPPQTGLNVL